MIIHRDHVSQCFSTGGGAGQGQVADHVYYRITGSIQSGGAGGSAGGGQYRVVSHTAAGGAGADADVDGLCGGAGDGELAGCAVGLAGALAAERTGGRRGATPEETPQTIRPKICATGSNICE